MTKTLTLKRDVLTELTASELRDVVAGDGSASIPPTCGICHTATMCSSCC